MDYYLIACGILLTVGLMLNVTDARMLLLTAVVGMGFFLPPPEFSAAAFYSFCIAVELVVAAVAMKLNRRSGIAEIAALLIVAHIMGFIFDGSVAFSPYHVIVKLLEASQILACMVLSPVLMPILRNRDAKTT